LSKKKTKLPSPLTLAEIFEIVGLNIDVRDDFEEYSEKWFRDPSSKTWRSDYLAHLKRAKRFKKFFSKEEIQSIPSLPDDRYENIQDENLDSFIDFNNESFLKTLSYSLIYLNDTKEYDKLADLQNTLEYHAKIVESYGYVPYTGDFDAKKFPITKKISKWKILLKILRITLRH
jgi:hypothetical protein